MALILDGKIARAKYAGALKKKISKLGRVPVLVILQIGQNTESSAYIKQKIKFADEIGVKVLHIKFEEDENEDEIVDKINTLNQDRSVDGIIVQIPLPPSLSAQKILDTIEKNKDVDGLSEANRELRKNGSERFLPAVILALALTLYRTYAHEYRSRAPARNCSQRVYSIHCRVPRPEQQRKMPCA